MSKWVAKVGQDGNSTTWCHLVSMIYLLCIVQYASGLIVKIMQTDAVQGHFCLGNHIVSAWRMLCILHGVCTLYIVWHRLKMIFLPDLMG